MKTLYLTCGLPGSGKTTYVNAHLAPKGVQVVCPDNLRLAYGHSISTRRSTSPSVPRCTGVWMWSWTNAMSAPTTSNAGDALPTRWAMR